MFLMQTLFATINFAENARSTNEHHLRILSDTFLSVTSVCGRDCLLHTVLRAFVAPRTVGMSFESVPDVIETFERSFKCLVSTQGL